MLQILFLVSRSQLHTQIRRSCDIFHQRAIVVVERKGCFDLIYCPAANLHTSQRWRLVYVCVVKTFGVMLWKSHPTARSSNISASDIIYCALWRRAFCSPHVAHRCSTTYASHNAVFKCLAFKVQSGSAREINKWIRIAFIYSVCTAGWTVQAHWFLIISLFGKPNNNNTVATTRLHVPPLALSERSMMGRFSDCNLYSIPYCLSAALSLYLCVCYDVTEENLSFQLISLKEIIWTQ